MTCLLWAVLLLQADPHIEKIERLSGPVNRRYLWAPLRVTLSSQSGWKGDLVAHSAMGFDVARSVEVAAKGRISVLLPSLDPEEVSAGPASRERLSRELSTPDFVVGVDARLAYARELASSDRVTYQTVELDALRRLLPLGLFEAFDLLLLADSSGLALGGVGAWRLAPTRDEAEAAVRELGRPPKQVELVDPKVWELAPREGLSPAKRDRLILISVLYMLVSFGTLLAVGRWRRRAVPLAALALSGLFLLVYAVFFPRGPLFIVEDGAEVVPPDGEARECRVWFAQSSSDLLTQIDFPAPVKPVLPSPYPPDRPFTIRIGERGSRVEGLNLRAGVSVCFAASGACAPSVKVVPRLGAPLYGVWLRLGEKAQYLGDLPAGAEAAKLAGGSAQGRPPPVALEVWEGFSRGDVLMGWSQAREGPALDVASPDLAQSRRRPRWIVGRLR